ncbi:YqhR family membrane protein [Bacillus sp. FJAT-27445]|uniref:YqhR family membrane protein n=1 Tax=Bacillus sp. FJAT-27445 TaxID=1679166 RepID=UPI000743AE0B|nr:YqhR family membrane protein [Bacillus sp. FJAT-27445]
MEKNSCTANKELAGERGFAKLVLLTGLWGGLFWSFIGQVGYYFHFTKISPRAVLGPWALGSWKNGWLGTLVAIVLIALISIGTAFIYSALLKKTGGILSGIGYGIVLFLLVFLLLNPMFPGISPFGRLDQNTMYTSICLFILYGVFIGYSISYDYKNRRGNLNVSE